MDKIKKNKIAIVAVICIIVLFIGGASEEHKLGKGFTYFETPGFVAYWKKGDTLQFNIPPKVIAYHNTCGALLIKQHPSRYSHSEDTQYVYPLGKDTVYYFFIDKYTKEVTGPLLYSEMDTFLHEKKLEQMLKKLE